MVCPSISLLGCYMFYRNVCVQVSPVSSSEAQTPTVLPVTVLAVFVTVAESALPSCSSGLQTSCSHLSTANLQRERDRERDMLIL